MYPMATATEFQHLLVERDGATARVTLNRPDRYNSLSLALMGELRRALEALGGDDTVQAVVIDHVPLFHRRDSMASRTIWSGTSSRMRA